MNRSVLLEREELLVRDVVRDTGVMHSLLNRPLGFATRRLSLIPPRSVRQSLGTGSRSSLIVVGGRCRVVPLAKIPITAAGFYSSLLDFIDSIDFKHDGRIEIEVLSSPDIPAGSLVGSPVFTLLRAERRLGYLAGRVDVSFHWPDANIGLKDANGGQKDINSRLWDTKTDEKRLQLWVHQYLPLPRLRRDVRRGEMVGWDDVDTTETDISLSRAHLAETNLSGATPSSSKNPSKPNVSVIETLLNEAFFSDGEVAAARHHLPKGKVLLKEDLQKVGDAAIAGVKAGDRVSIIFRRGNIWLEVPGKTYRSGDVGDQITVYQLDGHRRFTGIVIGPKEVEVEIP